MAIELYGPLGGLEFAEGLAETDPPFLANQVPTPGALGILPTTTVALRVDDLDSGVLLSSVIISIDAGGGPVVAYTSSAYQAGYTGTAIAGGTAGYDFVITPGAPIGPGLISIRVQATDVDGNVLDTTYTFTTIALLAVLPGVDTIRGGRELVFTAANLPLDGGGLLDETLRAIVLPSGWTPTLVGTGRTRSTLVGLELDTGSQASSSVVLTTDDSTLAHFDLAIDVEVLHPLAPIPGLGELVLLALELLTGAGDVFQLRLRLRGYEDPTRALATFATTPFGGTTKTFGTVPVEMDALRGPLTLRLVRNDTTVWAFVGSRDAALNADAWVSDPTLIGVAIAQPTGTVRPQLAVRNGTAGTSAIVRVQNYTVRSHVTIAGRLLDEKKVPFSTVLTGRVPAATLLNLGASAVSLFGPFGRAEGASAFRYTTPDPFSVTTPQVPLSTFTDPVLFDGPQRKKRRGGR